MDDDFYHLMAQAGFTRLSLAKWLGVSERTINRWIKHGAPLMTIRATELRAGSIIDGAACGSSDARS